MKNEFPYLIMLSNPEHYYIGICSMSGQDYVPYINADISEWLQDNMEKNVNYEFESNINPYKSEPEIEKVGIAFANEEDAVAFKLRWM